MSLVGQLVSHLEINASAQNFYNLWKDRVFHISNISPKIVQEVKVHEGDWDSHGHGSIKIWNYTIDGRPEIFKERVEFDDSKLKVTLIGLEGDVFKHYKKYNIIFQVLPKGPKHSLSVLTLEYEKLDDGCPYPYHYLDLLNSMIKDIESHLKD